MKKSENKVTRIITAEITVVTGRKGFLNTVMDADDKYDSVYPMTNYEKRYLAKCLKKILDVDDVVITNIQDFPSEGRKKRRVKGEE